ncbi:glycosyltransferase, partial [Actinocorallia lasiicapitis]
MPDSPLVIALISEHASPLADDIGGTDSGGQNVYVRELALALAALGHRVTVYTRRTSPRQPGRVALAPGADVVHVAAGPARELPKEDLAPLMGDFGDQLALHWQENPPDLVHAHYWMSGIAALAGARRTAIPVVTTFHALGLERIAHHPEQQRQAHRERERERERVGSERAVGQMSDAVIALTAEEVGYLSDQYGVPAAKISVVPVGVDLGRFAPDGPVWERTGRPRIVAVGRIAARKGLATVLEALTRLSDGIDAELVVAGGPAPERLDSDPEIRALRAVARVLGVEDRVMFLGRVPHERVPELLRSADVFVCAPHYEPFGTAALEAGACGVPVVATAVGGLRQHVLDGRTGLLVPPDDPTALATALSAVLADPARGAAMG